MKTSLFKYLSAGIFTGYAAFCLVIVIALSNYRLPGDDHFGEHLTTSTLLPDFAAIEQTPERKQAFLEMMLPLVEAKNIAIVKSRNSLLKMQTALESEQPLTTKQLSLLQKLRDRYHVTEEDEPDQQKAVAQLLLRADVIPESMVLAQAAVESGWGTSRFAGEAHNLFGQWCYTPGCGLVPARRASNAKHEVQLFENVEGAISAYFRNLNTHRAYQSFRKLRAQLREEGKALSGSQLVTTLGKYSSRGQAYIEELRTVIRANRLEALTQTHAHQPANAAANPRVATAHSGQ
ncbi:glucosaminidase domain-containing protein [Cellvibrio polysaccharolyticus]|uniref:Endo-beta-N-acetylglucosaminidase n=1 Tax=Cellvibrio polysaccharolyticus TaxID=2082724 RepID=A0A928V046_9GAMM|nr:glucosaminidase domain-containing protein [Cellvibrio polysaccharolyticus]MBE8716273.1 endo-beta-N-acetylglucosaminidase [Cellvibrio polysaccharolyticus]